ncbi:hypothetical protein [Stenotrophomonas beteli]|uniref:Uncharacterized protein n=1 Tax=Stenotrophomonas beteli TaxID=3384461 RepID=A0A0R0AXD0_9GAMM|nr:hypothetical protein [Stenotrophomonas maltophilia]KRG49305.1 hypothetical protein ARC23_14565 [Stenotrophomonas maltophilia]
MSGYEIKVSITPLCPCCGKESQSSGFVAESRAPQGVFDRDNPYGRTDQRVFISPCTDCFAPRVALNAAADALQHARDWIEEAGDRKQIPNGGTLARIDSALAHAKGGAR